MFNVKNKLKNLAGMETFAVNYRFGLLSKQYAVAYHLDNFQ